MDPIPIEIFKIYIFNELSYRDKLAYIYANPRSFESLKNELNIDQYFQKIFKKYNLDFNYFQKSFGKFGAKTLFYGGMLLGIIEDNISAESDFDFIHFLKNNKYEIIDKSIKIKNEYYLLYPSSSIKHDEISDKDKKLYQHNQLTKDVDNIYQHLNNVIDLDITKIILINGKLKIYDINKFFSKKDYVNINKYFYFQIKNYLNFFKIDLKKSNYFWKNYIWIKILIIMFLRIKKYKKRVYDIELSENISSKKKFIKNIFDKYGLIFKNIDKFYFINDFLHNKYLNGNKDENKNNKIKFKSYLKKYHIDSSIKSFKFKPLTKSKLCVIIVNKILKLDKNYIYDNINEIGQILYNFEKKYSNLVWFNDRYITMETFFIRICQDHYCEKYIRKLWKNFEIKNISLKVLNLSYQDFY